MYACLLKNCQTVSQSSCIILKFPSQQHESSSSSTSLPTLGIVSLLIFFKKLFIYLFIYLWLCWVFVSVRGLSLVAASGDHSSSWCVGLSLLRPLLLQSTNSRHTGSVVVAHRPSHSTACGIFPDQGSNLCKSFNFKHGHH